jgi:hypothetical protein
MRALRALVVALLLAAGLAGTRQDDQSGPAVFLLSGQSNMVGQGATDELPTDLATLPPTVRLFVDGERSRIADRPRFGPEVTFAHAMAAAWPDRDLVLVKFAVGGTSLLAWAPDWSEDEARRTQNAAAGPLFERLMDYAGVDLGPAARFAALLWMQGERDARYADIGPDYLARLDAFLSAARARLSAPDLPFLLGLVNPPADRYPAAGVVRAQQRAAPGRLAATTLIETDDLSKWPDNLHYDTAGQLELGRRFAAAYLESRGEAPRR